MAHEATGILIVADSRDGIMKMTNSTNAQPRLDPAKSKNRAKAIQSRLSELGVELKLSHAYEAMATAYGHRNWPTMNATIGTANEGSVSIAKLLPTGKEFALPFSACRRHIELIGHGGRNLVMSTLMARAVALGAGMVFTDFSVPGIDRNIGVSRILEVATQAGREKDVRILDFRGWSSVSSKYNPFANCSHIEMAAMLAGFIQLNEEIEWKGRAESMFSGICAALVWARDSGRGDITPGDVRTYINLKALIDLLNPEEDADIPSFVREEISSYLSGLPGYNPELGLGQSQTTIDQHGYIEMQFSRILGSLSATYRNVFDTRPPLLGRAPDILNMDKVVEEKLIVVALLPKATRSRDEATYPGRLIFHDIHRALKRRLVDGVVKPQTPFYLGFDEFDLHMGGMTDLGVVLDDLGASNACLIAASNTGVPLAEFKKSTSIYLASSREVPKDYILAKIVTPDVTASAWIGVATS